jgi:hypothetical protein
MKRYTKIIAALTVLIALVDTSVARDANVSAPPGSSYATAIRIPATTERDGVHWEHRYLAAHYRGARSLRQRLDNHAGRVYDVMTIATTDGKQQDVYFDISSYFGHF